MTEAYEKTPGSKQSVPEWALGYKARDFPPWSLTVDIVAVAVDLEKEDLQIAIITRGNPPFEGYEAWPGGFVKWGSGDEDPDGLAAARREFREETGHQHTGPLFELGTYDTAGRDPRQYAGYWSETSDTWQQTGTRVASRAFLAPLRKEGRRLSPFPESDAAASRWASVYAYLPWEDLRDDRAAERLQRIRRDLENWAGSVPERETRKESQLRVDRLFSPEDWNEEEAGARWSVIREAGLVEEANRDQWGRATGDTQDFRYGKPLAFDHREILADALEWLRTEIKRRPGLVAALVPPEFKLSELQSVFEAVSGRSLYRTNFRRLVTSLKGSRIVEPTGRMEEPSGPGKPAEYWRLQDSALRMRYSPGLTLPWRPDP